MTIVDYTLGQGSIKNIPFQQYQNDFTFIVDGKRYQTNRLVADILSPNIKKMHFTDPSIDEYCINTKNDKIEKSDEPDYFNEFLMLASFQNSRLDLSRQKIYSEYFYQLGNFDECIRIFQTPSQDPIPDNVLDRLLSFVSSKNDKVINPDYKSIKEIISFVASHFEDLHKEQMKKFDVDMLSEILNNENLKLSNEDSLLEFILSLYKEDYSYSPLFEYVLFSNVSQEALEKFTNEVSFDDINWSIWRSICNALVKSKSPKINRSRYVSVVVEKNHIEGKEFNGILHYLTDETGGNIHDNDTIEITSNSVFQNFHPKNLVDYESPNYYESLINTNAIICFDFKDKLVEISSYSIKTNSNPRNGNHLKSWVVEVSNDENSWEVIDSHVNDESLNDSNAIRTFSIKEPTSFCRYVRLRQTGPSWENGEGNWGGSTIFLMSCFEIYGKLKQK